ncbi:MAG: nucleotidyltransferase family protein [Candidatus Sulfotelmatobacter sp.]|jgi:hypothetical protein
MSPSSPSHPAPSTAIHREWDVLRAACSPHPQIVDQQRLRALLEVPVDWDGLVQMANHHGTPSLLFQNLSALRDSTPPEVLNALRQQHETNIHKSLFLARELFRILDCLSALGIEAIPYKGLALSEAYYGDMAMRQCGDMDLFVRAKDVSRIRGAVRVLGYTPRLPIPHDAEDAYVASGYECTFDHPAGRNLLELQWALQPRYYAVDFDMTGLFERAVEIAVAGRPIKTVAPGDLLLVLAVHAAKHVWGRLIWLCDIAQILRRENLNWSWIESRARADGIRRILHVTLLLANRFLETEIPAPLRSAIERDQPAQGLAEEIAPGVLSGVSYEEEKISYFRLMMRLRERRIDRLLFLTRLALTPGPGEWESIRLPKRLFSLYRLVRMARLASRLARARGIP